ncbi:hypothetical protein BZA70DRAFT_283447 [Myxozyma melibiosi]|uniref:TFIIS N-terminal domain-containing protein n=1 Tax=Myxozyma melibiosi TaxID=54550 RepID=A0ABR1F0F6_9ASCO
MSDKEEQSDREEDKVVQEEAEKEELNNNNLFDDDEDELSDLDEDQFQDINEDNVGLPISTDVFQKVQRHKRAKDDSEPAAPKKRKERTRTARRSEAAGDDGKPARKRQPKKAEEGGKPRNDYESLDPDARRLRELEDKLDAALKPQKKRKKVDEDDIEQMQDERIVRVRDQMREAAMRDAEAIKDGLPAVHKLKMLPEVRSILQKHSLYDSILDNNMLESVRLWLEPLPDASLPSYSIQKEMFAALEELPIKTTHLRESGVGKVVLFYQQSRKPEVSIKHIAEKLVGDWSRPIISRNKKRNLVVR